MFFLVDGYQNSTVQFNLGNLTMNFQEIGGFFLKNPFIKTLLYNLNFSFNIYFQLLFKKALKKLKIDKKIHFY